MSNLVTVNSGSAIDGTLKAGRIAIATSASINPSDFYEMVNPAGGYVFITDPKIQGYNDGPPQIYQSPSTLPADVLATINGLPDRVGSGSFDNVWDALRWVHVSNKYFILNKTLNDFPSSTLKLNLDSSQLSSYPQSGSLLHDLSGNGKYGTLVNGPVFNSNGWFYFDGVDDRISTQDPGYPSSGTDAFSLATTFRVPTGATWYNQGSGTGIIGRGSYAGSIGIFRNSTDGGVSFWTRLNGGNIYDPDAYNLARDRFYHVVGTFDGVDTAKIYVNGEYIDQEVNSNNAGTLDAGGFNIGGGTAFGGNNGGYGEGDISSNQLYGKALTDQEINQLYHGSNIVTEGLTFAANAGNLVSYAKSGTTMYSLTGSLSGSLINGVSYTDSYNGSFNFDGTNDYISTEPFDMGTPTDITLECWIRFDGTLDSNDRKVMHYDKTGTTNAVFQLRKGTTNSRLMYQAHNGSQWYTMTDDDAIEANTWAHFTITHAGTSAVMYKNGVQSATATMGNLDWTNANNLLIGYRAASEYWKGDIAVMRIYNRALSTTEIQQNYNAEYSRFISSRDITKEDLILELDAHNPDSYLSGTTWTDLSGAGNNGTLTNSPVYSIDNGGVFTFDGVDDYVALGNLNTNIYHISLWVYLDSNVTSTKASTGLFYYGGSGASLQSGVSFGSSTGFLTNETLTILNENPSATYQRTGIFDTIPAGWRYISFNWNGSSYDIYIDGDKKTTSAGSSTGHAPLMIASDFELASNYDGNPQFEGKISSVKIYDQALDEHQIISNYNTQSPLYKVQLPRTTTDSLVLNLDAGDTTSYPKTGATWYDRSGNGHNVTLYNDPTYNFSNGGSITFDGTDDYGAMALTGQNFDSTGFTLETWVKLLNEPGAWRTTFNIENASNSNHIDIRNSNGYGRMTINYYPGSSDINAGFVDINENEWHHLVGVWDGSELILYLNGQQSGSTASMTSLSLGTSPNFQIGRAYSNNRYINDEFSLVRVYDRGLTPSEVLENYNASKGRFE